MSIFGLLFRFACVYIAILVAISVAFARIGVSPNSAINTGALIGAVFLGCGWFITMNKRTLIDREKRIAFLGMWAIDLALQGIAVVGVCALSGFKITFGPLLLVFGIVGISHGVGIYFLVGMANKLYARQLAKDVLPR